MAFSSVPLVCSLYRDPLLLLIINIFHVSHELSKIGSAAHWDGLL
jgi:hypothetical protein